MELRTVKREKDALVVVGEPGLYALTDGKREKDALVVVAEPGLYALTDGEYHSDPCPRPSLNHTVAKLVHDRSPLHGWRAHPRLGNKSERPNRVMDIGTAVHAHALGVGSPITKLNFKDFRTKAAQETRDAMIANGITPLLAADYDTVMEMVPLMRMAIEEVAGMEIGSLHREVTAIGLEDGTYSRSKIDVMTPDLRLLIDAKTTVSANPEDFGRYAMNTYATAVAFYFQTLDLIDPEGIGKRRFVFIAQERDCPEAITFHELDNMALELADGQMRRARRIYAECLAADKWPAYPRTINRITPRLWQMEQERMREYAENADD